MEFALNQVQVMVSRKHFFYGPAGIPFGCALIEASDGRVRTVAFDTMDELRANLKSGVERGTVTIEQSDEVIRLISEQGFVESFNGLIARIVDADKKSYQSAYAFGLVKVDNPDVPRHGRLYKKENGRFYEPVSGPIMSLSSLLSSAVCWVEKKEMSLEDAYHIIVDAFGQDLPAMVEDPLVTQIALELMTR